MFSFQNFLCQWNWWQSDFTFSPLQQVLWIISSIKQIFHSSVLCFQNLWNISDLPSIYIIISSIFFFMYFLRERDISLFQDFFFFNYFCMSRENGEIYIYKTGRSTSRGCWSLWHYLICVANKEYWRKVWNQSENFTHLCLCFLPPSVIAKVSRVVRPILCLSIITERELNTQAHTIVVDRTRQVF